MEGSQVSDSSQGKLKNFNMSAKCLFKRYSKINQEEKKSCSNKSAQIKSLICHLQNKLKNSITSAELSPMTMTKITRICFMIVFSILYIKQDFKQTRE